MFLVHACALVILFTVVAQCLHSGKEKNTINKKSKEQVPKSPNTANAKIKDEDYLEDADVLELSDAINDWSEEEQVKDITKALNDPGKIDVVTAKNIPNNFKEKYGTGSSRNTKNKFKDFIHKYEPTTILEQIDKEQIKTGKNITHQEKIISIVKGIDSIDELLSLRVENGHAKLPKPVNGRRFRVGLHNKENLYGFNNMHIHQYVIELMKQAIYQARNRMTFMQDLRNRHRTSGLYKMGFLFAKADYAGKVFASICQKAFRTCSMLRQGISGVYRPFMHYLDIVYALERIEAKWFDVDLLMDLIVMNDDIVKNVIFKNKTLETPRALAKALDDMFIE